ncbi:MAG TPA: phospho-N-acetylmuramoyl-pentapeptide-transferase [Bacillota bacterium]
MIEISEFLQTILLSLARYLLILIVSYILTWLSFPYLYRLMVEGQLVRPNYREERIPAVAGLLFVVLLPLTTGLGMAFSVKSFTTVNAVLFLWVILGMGLIGFIDDVIGDHTQKGFKGHFRALFKDKRLTTGGLKAFFGAVIALVFSIATANLVKGKLEVWPVISNFLLVALCANSLNLFDLRPGRAGKIFIAGFVIVLMFSQDFEVYTGLFVPILAIMLYYLPYDLKARVMMGDVGSNLLGASLGVMMAWMFSDLSKLIAIILLVILQLTAEKISFSKVIDQHRLLRSLDEIGRRQH